MDMVNANRITMCLGDLSFHFVAESPAMALRMPPEYTPFLSLSVPIRPDVLYTVSRRRAVPVTTGRATILWASETTRLWRAPGYTVGLDYFHALDQQWRFAAQLHSDFSGGILYPTIRVGDPSTAIPLYHPHDRIVVLGRLTGAGAGVLHAAAVEDAGRGIIFVGPSGAGKTTLSRLWRQAGATLLNDERVIVRWNGGQRVGVAATPWHGVESQVSAMTATLSAVFFIKQAPGNRIRRMGPAESAARLLTATILPVFLADGVARITHAWSEVASHVPSYELEFTPDARAVACVRAQLLSGGSANVTA